MAKSEGVNEQFKVSNAMLWVQKMNNIREKASEIINAEVIFPDWKHKPLAEMQAIWYISLLLDKIPDFRGWIVKNGATLDIWLSSMHHFYLFIC